jgi:NADH-quinone oxidoreductase subunit A
MQYAFLPILLLVVCAVVLAAGLVVVAGALNPGRDGRVTRMPYESGMDPIHDTRRRFDVRFHLVAIAFLVFDVELLFLYPWAVAMGGQTNAERGTLNAELTAGSTFGVQRSAFSVQRSPSPGIDAAVAAGWVESRDIVFGGAMLFFVLLVLGFVYDWRKGVFRWR